MSAAESTATGKAAEAAKQVTVVRMRTPVQKYRPDGRYL
jgi:hypothetical protein